MSDEKIKISGVKGDVIFGSGTGNIVGKNVTISGNVTISSQQLAQMPNEYAKSLEAFTQTLNQLLEKHRISREQVAPVQEKVQELAKEMEGIRGDQVGIVKKDQVRSKFSAVVDAVVKLLPKGAEVAAACTPLAPFSKLIGQGVQQLVEAIQKES